MAKLISDLAPVYVVGVGFHRYQHASASPYVTQATRLVGQVTIAINYWWDA